MPVPEGAKMPRRLLVALCAASIFCVTAFVSGRLADWTSAPGADFPLVGGDYAKEAEAIDNIANKSSRNELQQRDSTGF